jgi:hypothetical protein
MDTFNNLALFDIVNEPVDMVLNNGNDISVNNALPLVLPILIPMIPFDRRAGPFVNDCHVTFTNDGALKLVKIDRPSNCINPTVSNKGILTKFKTVLVISSKLPPINVQVGNSIDITRDVGTLRSPPKYDKRNK